MFGSRFSFGSCSARGQQGFTLVELVVALAVIGILVAAFVATTSVIGTGRSSNAVESVKTLADAAIQYHAAHPNSRYNGISMGQLVNEKMIPVTMQNAGVNPWGGDYTVVAINNGNDFRITVTAVPDVATANKIIDPLSNRATGTYNAATQVVTYDFVE